MIDALVTGLPGHAQNELSQLLALLASPLIVLMSRTIRGVMRVRRPAARAASTIHQLTDPRMTPMTSAAGRR